MLQPKNEAETEALAVEHKKATPLRPAIWMTGVLVWATVIAFVFRVPTWAGIFLCTITGLSFLSYLVPFVYLMINDRDSLRQERLKTKGLPPSHELLESAYLALPEAQGNLPLSETPRLALDQPRRKKTSV